MRTFPLRKSESGKQHAFEIEVVYVTRRALQRVLFQIPGVSAVRIPRRGGDDGCTRLEFNFQGIDCVISEPYGDNSRYYVGPKEGDWGQLDPSEILKIEEAFKHYRPPLLRKIVGDLLSLNFKELLKRE